MRAALAIAAAILAGLAAQAQSATRTVWDGVYSSAQAQRGRTAYNDHCSQCHGADLSGSYYDLKGDTFMRHWEEDSLASFYTTMKTEMPRGRPGSLSDATYLDIAAYILQANKFPQGQRDLTGDALAGVRVQRKSGPEPLQTGALVDVIGCLAAGPAKSWTVERASEPVRTRNPSDSTPAELKAWDAKALGPHKFSLMDVDAFDPEPLKGAKVEVKGFIIRKSGDDKINLTTLQVTGSQCGP